MNRVSLLDCTLRDGGYINDFRFGKRCIETIIRRLQDAKLEIVECGFLQSGKCDPDRSLFGGVEAIKAYLPEERSASTMFVAMIAYGDISLEEISDCDGSSVTGIRLTFHEKEIEDAFAFAVALKEKGYKVFFQPVGTMTYTDRALLALIDKVNVLQPFAFYLVDTLGSMYKNDLLRMYYLVDNNLDAKVRIGFHSHNNLQLSFSNAQELILMHPKRDIIIDTSVYGMGRGAGNLCTELLTQYINRNIVQRYDLLPILECVDEYILPINLQHSWGYSVPYYLAAVNGCHPNYANYLVDRQTLCVRDINNIIRTIPSHKKPLFDKELIKKLYQEYLERSVDDSGAIEELKALCRGRQVLILAPGQSLSTHTKEIEAYIREKSPVVFGINHIPLPCYKFDRIFVSNLKRFKGIDDLLGENKGKVVCTSNISTDKNFCVLNYASYLNDDDAILDNAGLMLINILKKAGVTKFALAGYDGFDHAGSKNYFDERMINSVEAEKREAINRAIVAYFKQARESVTIDFITPTTYEEAKDV